MLVVEMQNDTISLEKIYQFFFKLKINLLYDLAIPILDAYPREMKTYAITHTNLHKKCQCKLYS